MFKIISMKIHSAQHTIIVATVDFVVVQRPARCNLKHGSFHGPPRGGEGIDDGAMN